MKDLTLEEAFLALQVGLSSGHGNRMALHARRPAQRSFRGQGQRRGRGVQQGVGSGQRPAMNLNEGNLTTHAPVSRPLCVQSTPSSEDVPNWDCSLGIVQYQSIGHPIPLTQTPPPLSDLPLPGAFLQGHNSPTKVASEVKAKVITDCQTMRLQQGQGFLEILDPPPPP